MTTVRVMDLMTMVGTHTQDDNNNIDTDNETHPMDEEGNVHDEEEEDEASLMSLSLPPPQERSLYKYDNEDDNHHNNNHHDYDYNNNDDDDEEGEDDDSYHHRPSHHMMLRNNNKKKKKNHPPPPLSSTNFLNQELYELIVDQRQQRQQQRQEPQQQQQQQHDQVQYDDENVDDEEEDDDDDEYDDEYEEDDDDEYEEDDDDDDEEEPWDQRIATKNSRDSGSSFPQHMNNHNNNHYYNQRNGRQRRLQQQQQQESFHERPDDEEDDDDDEYQEEVEYQEEDYLEDTGDLPSLSPVSSKKNPKHASRGSSNSSGAMVAVGTTTAAAPTQFSSSQEEEEQEEEQAPVVPIDPVVVTPTTTTSQQQQSTNNNHNNNHHHHQVAQLDEKGRHFWRQLDTSHVDDDDYEDLSSSRGGDEHMATIAIHDDDDDLRRRRQQQLQERIPENEQERMLKLAEEHKKYHQYQQQQQQLYYHHVYENETQSGQDSVMDNTFCGQTLTALTELCGYSQLTTTTTTMTTTTTTTTKTEQLPVVPSKTSLSSRSYARHLEQLRQQQQQERIVGQDNKDDKLSPPLSAAAPQQQQQDSRRPDPPESSSSLTAADEQTAIEVEFVDPSKRKALEEAAAAMTQAAHQKKDVYLAAKARLRLEEQEQQSQQQRQRQAQQQQQHDDDDSSTMTGPQINLRQEQKQKQQDTSQEKDEDEDAATTIPVAQQYANMTTHEKRLFLQYINDGEPPAKAAKRIMVEKKAAAAAVVVPQDNKLNNNKKKRKKKRGEEMKLSSEKSNHQQAHNDSNGAAATTTTTSQKNKLRRRGLAIFWKKKSLRGGGVGRSFDSASPLTDNNNNNKNYHNNDTREDAGQDNDNLAIRRTRSTPSGSFRSSSRSRSNNNHDYTQRRVQSDLKTPLSPTTKATTTTTPTTIAETPTTVEAATAANPSHNKNNNNKNDSSEYHHHHYESPPSKELETMQQSQPHDYHPDDYVLQPLRISLLTPEQDQQQEEQQQQPPPTTPQEFRESGVPYYDGTEDNDDDEYGDNDEEEYDVVDYDHDRNSDIGGGGGSSSRKSNNYYDDDRRRREDNNNGGRMTPKNVLSSLSTRVGLSPTRERPIAFKALKDDDDDYNSDDDDDDYDNDVDRAQQQQQQQRDNGASGGDGSRSNKMRERRHGRSRSAPQSRGGGSGGDFVDKSVASVPVNATVTADDTRTTTTTTSTSRDTAAITTAAAAIATRRAQKASARQRAISSLRANRLLGRSRRQEQEQKQQEEPEDSTQEPEKPRVVPAAAGATPIRHSPDEPTHPTNYDDDIGNESQTDSRDLHQQEEEEEQTTEESDRQQEEIPEADLAYSSDDALPTPAPTPLAHGNEREEAMSRNDDYHYGDEDDDEKDETEDARSYEETDDDEPPPPPPRSIHEEPGEMQIVPREEKKEENTEEHYEDEKRMVRPEGVTSSDHADLEMEMDAYMNSTDIYSVIQATTSMDDNKSTYTTVSSMTGVVSPGGTPRRSRRPGVAKSRLAKAKEADKLQKGKPKMGWHESIQAAAASAHRQWRSESGFQDYQPPQQPSDAELFMEQEMNGDDTAVVAHEKMHLDLTNKLPAPKKKTAATNSVAPKTPTRSIDTTADAGTTEVSSEPLSPELEHELIEWSSAASMPTEEELLLEAISSPSSEVRRSRSRRKLPKSTISTRSTTSEPVEDKPRGWIESMRAASVVLYEDGQRWNPATGWKNPQVADVAVYDDAADFGGTEEEEEPTLHQYEEMHHQAKEGERDQEAALVRKALSDVRPASSDPPNTGRVPRTVASPKSVAASRGMKHVLDSTVDGSIEMEDSQYAVSTQPPSHQHPHPSQSPPADERPSDSLSPSSKPRGWVQPMKAASVVLNQEGQTRETDWKEPQMAESKQSLSPRRIETSALEVSSSSTPHEAEIEPTNSNSRLSSSPHHLIPPNLASRSIRSEQRNNYSGTVRKVGGRQAPRTGSDERNYGKSGVASTMYHGKRSQETVTPSDYIQIDDDGSLHVHEKIEGEEGISVNTIAIGDRGSIYLAESRQNTGEELTSDAIKNLKEYDGSTEAMESTPELDETGRNSNENRASPDSLLGSKYVVKTGKKPPSSTSRDDHVPLEKKDPRNNEIELSNNPSSFPSIGERDHLPEGSTTSVVTEKVGEKEMGLFPEPEKRSKKSPKTSSRAERAARVDLDKEFDYSRLSGPIDLDEVYDEWTSAGENDNSNQWETRSGHSSATATRASKHVPKLKANKRDTSPISERGKRNRLDEHASPEEKREQHGHVDDDHSETFTPNRSPLGSPAESTTKQQGRDYQGHVEQQTADEVLRSQSSSPVFQDAVETLSSGGIETGEISRELGIQGSTMQGSEHSPRVIPDPRELLRQLSKSPISLMTSSVDSGQRRNPPAPQPEQPEQRPNRQEMERSRVADLEVEGNSHPMHIGERIDSKENDDEEDSLFCFDEKAPGTQNKDGQYARQQAVTAEGLLNKSAVTYREEDQHRDDRLGEHRLEKRVRDRRSTGRLEDKELEERSRQRREEGVVDRRRSSFDGVKNDDADKKDSQRRDRYVRDISSRRPNHHGNDRSTSQDDDEDDDDVVDKGERFLPTRDRYTAERLSVQRGINEERPPDKSEDISGEFMGHLPSASSDIYGSEGYGCQDRSFFQRLSECAAPVMGAKVGDLPAAHLAFLRDHPTSVAARQSPGKPNTGHPENIVEDEADYETEPGVDSRELLSLKLKEMYSLDDNRFNSQKRSGSVVSDDIGAKTAYLESIAMKTAVSSKRRKRRSSTGRGDAPSTVSTSSLNHSEKWKAFLERKKAGGLNSGAISSNRTHVTDVSKAAERYAAAKVQEMMKMPKGLPRPKSAPRVGRNEHYISRQQVLRSSNSSGAVGLRSAAEDLAHARVEAIEAAMKSAPKRHEASIVSEI